MTGKKLEKLFELCNELYTERLKESGMRVLPFFWAVSNRTGELLVFSAFGTPSKDIAAKLGITLPNVEAPSKEERENRPRSNSIMKNENENERLTEVLKSQQLIELLKDVRSQIGNTAWPSLAARVSEMIEKLERSSRRELKFVT